MKPSMARHSITTLTTSLSIQPTRHFIQFTPFPTYFTRKPSISTPLHFPLYKTTTKFSTLPVSSSSSSSSMGSIAKKVLVPAANGTEPLEAVITIDVLRRAGAEVTVASVEKERCVDACHGVKIVADSLIDDCTKTKYDLISLTGGMPGAVALKDCHTLKNIVEEQAADGRLHAAICASPAVVLGSWGLLKGLKATCYPSFMDQLSTSATAVESRVQQDGNVVTSRGPGTSMEYAVALVEQLYGKKKADEVEAPLVMRPNHGDEFLIRELNSMQWTYNGCPEVLVPIADGSEEMEAVIIIDVLRRAKAKVVVASVGEKLEVLASRKVKLVADVHLDEAAKSSYDLIVLPGGLGGAEAFAASETLVEMLKKQREANRPYGAICASPALVLEPHGLLKDKKATAFPAMCSKLSDPSEIENRVVVDGNLITSRGPGTTMEFALAIVEKFFGREKAIELAKTMLFVHP
ncbi:protein DJ-1 homolog B [Silene latifolia]|uniref:protein DJ-1 homolog B n=1 Tax=Silene latifolia TaxID=37657 RepID=UPI003D780D9D